MITPLTTPAGVQIGKEWHPVPIPRELTYEELWTQRLLLGEPVGGRRGTANWPIVVAMLTFAMVLLGVMR